MFVSGATAETVSDPLLKQIFMHSEFFKQQMKIMVFFSNQVSPQEVAELSNELTQRIMDTFVRSEPIQKMPQALSRLNTQQVTAVVLLTNGLQTLPPALLQPVARLEGTNVALIMHPTSISSSNPSAVIAKTKWQVFQAVAKQWTKETVNTPRKDLQVGGSKLSSLSSSKPAQQPPSFAVYTLRSYDQQFNSVMAQLADKYKDKGVQLRNIGSVQDIKPQAGERPMLVVSGQDAARVIPQLAMYPMRNTLFTAVLSPTAGDAGWNNEFSVVATRPEQIENELDGVLQRMFIANKVASSKPFHQNSMSPTQIPPGPPIVQTVKTGQVAGSYQSAMIGSPAPRATSAPQQLSRQVETRSNVMVTPAINQNFAGAPPHFANKAIHGGQPGSNMIDKPRPSNQTSIVNRISHTSQIASPPQVNTYNSYYMGNPTNAPHTTIQQAQQQQHTVSTMVYPTASHMVTTSHQPFSLSGSRVGGRPVSADYRIRMQSAKRHKKSKQTSSINRQSTIYALQSADPRFFAMVESLGIVPAFHPVRMVVPGQKFPPQSILISPYERRQEVIHSISNKTNKDLSCVFFGQNLMSDPIMMNHPQIDLATNSIDQVKQYLAARGILMVPVQGSVPSINVVSQQRPVSPQLIQQQTFGVVQMPPQRPSTPLSPSQKSQRSSSQVGHPSGIAPTSPIASNFHSSQLVPPPPQLGQMQIQAPGPHGQQIHQVQQRPSSALNHNMIQTQTQQIDRVTREMVFQLNQNQNQNQGQITQQMMQQGMQQIQQIDGNPIQKPFPAQSNLMSPKSMVPERANTAGPPGQYPSQITPIGIPQALWNGSQQSINTKLQLQQQQKKEGPLRNLQNPQSEIQLDLSDMNIDSKESIIDVKLDSSIRYSGHSLSKQNSSRLGSNSLLDTQAQQKKKQLLRKIADGDQAQFQYDEQQKRKVLKKITDGYSVVSQQGEEEKKKLLKKIIDGYKAQSEQAEQEKKKLLKKIADGYKKEPQEAEQLKKQALSKIVDGFEMQKQEAQRKKKEVLKKIADGKKSQSAESEEQKKKLLKKIVDGYAAQEEYYQQQKKKILKQIQDGQQVNPKKAEDQKRQLFKKIVDGYEAMQVQQLEKAQKQKKYILKKITDAYKANGSPAEQQARAEQQKKQAIQKVTDGYSVTDSGPTMLRRQTKGDGVQQMGVSMVSASEYSSSDPDDTGSRFRRGKKKKRSPQDQSNITEAQQGNRLPNIPSESYLPNIDEGKHSQDNNGPIHQSEQNEFMCIQATPLLPAVCYFTAKHNIPRPHTHVYSIPSRVLVSHSSTPPKHQISQIIPQKPDIPAQKNTDGEFDTLEPPLLPPQQAPQILGQRLIKDSDQTVLIEGKRVVVFPTKDSDFQTVIYGPLPMAFEAKSFEYPQIIPTLKIQASHWLPQNVMTEIFNQPWLPKQKGVSSKGVFVTPLNPEMQNTITPKPQNIIQQLNQHQHQPQRPNQQLSQHQQNQQQQQTPFYQYNRPTHRQTQINRAQSLHSFIPQRNAQPVSVFPISNQSNTRRIQPQFNTMIVPQRNPSKALSSNVGSNSSNLNHAPNFQSSQIRNTQHITNIPSQDSIFNQAQPMPISQNHQQQPQTNQHQIFRREFQQSQQPPQLLPQFASQMQTQPQRFAYQQPLITQLQQQPHQFQSKQSQRPQQSHQSQQSQQSKLQEQFQNQSQYSSNVPYQTTPTVYQTTPSFQQRKEPSYSQTIYGGSTYRPPAQAHTSDFLYEQPKPEVPDPFIMDSPIKLGSESTSLNNTSYHHVINSSNRLTIQSTNLRHSRRTLITNADSRILSPGLDRDKYDMRVENGVTIFSRKSKDRSSSLDYKKAEVIQSKDVHHLAATPYIRVPEYSNPTPAQQYGQQPTITSTVATAKPKTPVQIIRSSSYKQSPITNRLIEPSEYEEVKSSQNKVEEVKPKYTQTVNQQSRTRSEAGDGSGLMKESRTLVEVASSTGSRKAGGILYMCPYNKDNIRRALYNIASVNDKIQYYLSEKDLKKINMDKYDHVYVFPIDEERPPSKLNKNAFLVRMNSISSGPRDIVIRDVKQLKNRNIATSASNYQIQQQVVTQSGYVNYRSASDLPDRAYDVMTRKEIRHEVNPHVDAEYFEAQNVLNRIQKKSYMLVAEHDEIKQLRIKGKESSKPVKQNMKTLSQEAGYNGSVESATRRVYTERTYYQAIQPQNNLKLKIFYSFDEPELAQSLDKEVGDQADLVKYYDYKSLMERTHENRDGFIIYVLDQNLSHQIDSIKKVNPLAKFLVYDREGREISKSRDPDTIEAQTVDAVIDIVRSMI